MTIKNMMSSLGPMWENVNTEEDSVSPEEILDDEDDTLENDTDDNEIAVNDDEFMAEVNYAILYEAFALNNEQEFKQYLIENHSSLIADKILTENQMTKSYISLSPMARKQKAVNLLKLRMAKQAKDTRYIKAVRLRAAYKRLLDQIRSDSRYKIAETIINKQQFRIVSNPSAAAASQMSKRFKLSN